MTAASCTATGRYSQMQDFYCRWRLHRVHAADGFGVGITFLNARGEPGRVLLGVRAHAEAAEGDASPCRYELTLWFEALLSVGVHATCKLPTACVDTAARGARRLRQARCFVSTCTPWPREATVSRMTSYRHPGSIFFRLRA